MNQRTLILTVLFAVSYLLALGQGASKTVVKLSPNNPSTATTANTPATNDGLYVREVSTSTPVWYNDIIVHDGGIKFKAIINNNLSTGFVMTHRNSGLEFAFSTLDNLSTPMMTDVNGFLYFPNKLLVMGGSTFPADASLSVNGKIYARKLHVDAVVWADHVFSSDYKLLSLSDLDQYIKSHKHLPELPSSQEVSEQGIDVARTDKVLLQKVEELSLYIIDQQKRIENQRKRIAELEK